jgi:hypothetical protein
LGGESEPTYDPWPTAEREVDGSTRYASDVDDDDRKRL